MEIFQFVIVKLNQLERLQDWNVVILAKNFDMWKDYKEMCCRSENRFTNFCLTSLKYNHRTMKVMKEIISSKTGLESAH